MTSSLYADYRVSLCNTLRKINPYVAIATSQWATPWYSFSLLYNKKNSLAQDVNLGLVTVTQSLLRNLQTRWLILCFFDGGWVQLHVGYKIIITEERLLCRKSGEESSDLRCSQKLFTTEHPFPLRLHGRHHRVRNWCWITFSSMLRQLG